jgi:Helix-turn-helix.
MGRKSIKEDKNIYFQIREGLGWTRQKASDNLHDISEDRLERIENGTIPRPDEVKKMVDVYKKPELFNYYCANQCDLGDGTVKKIHVADLSRIILEMIASLNSIEKMKDELIDITADGEISGDELREFSKIQTELNHISLTVETLKLWTDQMIANGKIDKVELDKYLNDDMK